MNTEQTQAICTLFVTVIVNVANALGFALDFDMWLQLALSVAALASVIWTWWKNQNLTEAAQEAQGYLNLLKQGKDDFSAPEDWEPEANLEAMGNDEQAI